MSVVVWLPLPFALAVAGMASWITLFKWQDASIGMMRLASRRRIAQSKATVRTSNVF